MKPASSNLHNKDMIIHAGSMAEVTETNELHAIIILKYKLLIKLYTNETRMH